MKKANNKTVKKVKKEKKPLLPGQKKMLIFIMVSIIVIALAGLGTSALLHYDVI
ncbi:MAG: hypothetical protein KAG91_00285 [Mycoplasmataceae bacterium]|nr:hypothetical protein [Mycoplasmataceae bacterium]